MFPPSQNTPLPSSTCLVAPSQGTLQAPLHLATSYTLALFRLLLRGSFPSS